MTDNNLQLSGTESIWLDPDGSLKIYGQEIHPTLDGEVTGRIVGIIYPPEFVLQLLDFLMKYEDALMLATGCDPLDDTNQTRWDDVERNDPMDGDHQSGLASAGWGNDEDYLHDTEDSWRGERL